MLGMGTILKSAAYKYGHDWDTNQNGITHNKSQGLLMETSTSATWARQNNKRSSLL